MVKLERYRQIIRQVLGDSVVLANPPESTVKGEIIVDPVTDQFVLIDVGWQGRRRMHSTVYHLSIQNEKIWIQYDGTDRPIADQLVEAGIPKSDIVLAEKPPEVRQYTGYGLG